MPLSPFVCATERNSLNENEDADQRFSVSRQQNTPKTYLPAASPRAPLRPVSVAVWKKGINTFTFRCNQTKCRTTEFVSSILNSLLSLSSLNSSTPSPFKLVDFPSALSLSLSPLLLSTSPLSAHISPLLCLLSLLLMFPDDKAGRLDYVQTSGAGSTQAAWGSYRQLQLESEWQVARSCSHGSLLPLTLSAAPQLSARAAVCCSLSSFCRVISFKFCLFSRSLPVASGLAGWPALQIWKRSTLQASQQMAVRTYARWCPLQHESCSAKRATVTVQQIQVVTTVVGGRSKQLFGEVLHVCLW